MRLFSLILCLLFFIPLAQAQGTSSVSIISDSTAAAKARNKKLYSGPRKATILSAILPGAGQVYNKKYWKVPIIYAGLGGFGYMFYVNNSEYNNFRQAVRAAYDDDPNTTYDTRYTPDDLQTLKLFYRKNRDISIFGMGAFYLINIIDANVDAHLKTFDVSDDLSFNVSPWPTWNTFSGPIVGLRIKLNIK